MIRDDLKYLFLAVVQAALLYWLHGHIDRHGAALTWMLPAYALTLALPTTIFILRERLGSFMVKGRLFGMMLWLLCISLYAGWALQYPDGSIDHSLAAYVVTMAVAWFFLTLVCGHGLTGLWRHPADTWQSVERILSLCLFAGLFTGVLWLMLWLGAALFSIIGLDFLKQLLGQRAVVYPVTATAVCFALTMGAHRFSGNANSGLLRIIGLLHWPVSVLTLLFLISLLGTGMQPLWQTGHASAILLCWTLALLGLANCAVQGGTLAIPSRSSMLAFGLVVTPVFPALALWSLGLRLEQYGFSEDRLWALYLVVFLLAYSLAVALVAMHALVSKRWTWLPAVNAMGIGFGLLLITLCWLPPLHPQSLAAYRQAHTLLAGKVDPKDFDFRFLRFEAGRPGLLALQQIRDDAKGPSAERLKRYADTYLALTDRFQQAEPEPLPEPALTVLQGPPLPPSLRDALLGWRQQGKSWRGFHSAPCLRHEAGCRLVALDLDGDGRDEYILADSGAIFRQASDGQWQPAGRLEVPGKPYAYDGEALIRQAGKLSTTSPRWQDVTADGQRWRVVEQTEP